MANVLNAGSSDEQIKRELRLRFRTGSYPVMPSEMAQPALEERIMALLPEITAEARELREKGWIS